MRFFAAALIFLGAASYGQSPQVPHKMRFSGMSLTIHDDAREEIQKDVDALSQRSRYFTMKVERARTYFPIIEKIFKEENIPDDFKYLVLQESALVADAVSVSDAVGYWQFKDFTALSMGMRVDQQVDERMNIHAATRGAARFLNQNNKVLDNWLCTLQSYQMGLGGARKVLGDQFKGASHMDITRDTYWYVKKFLAHKVAFEDAVEGDPSVKVIPLEVRSGKSLSEIASEISVEEEKLKEFNKWARRGEIPTDKAYILLIPQGDMMDFTKLTLTSAREAKANPLVEQAKPSRVEAAGMKEINGVPVLTAAAGETVAAMAVRGKVSLKAFLRYNEMTVDHRPRAGERYFLAMKKKGAASEHYKVAEGDNLWNVSQHFGVREKQLMRFNDLAAAQKLTPGTLLWMQGRKPDETRASGGSFTLELDDEEFEWGIGPEKKLRSLDEVQSQARKEVPMLESVAVLIDSAAPQGKPVEQAHLVVRGETYYSIAKQYSVRVMDLLSWNGLTIENGLKPGQRLKVMVSPSTTDAAVESTTDSKLIIHEVTAADSLYSVARKYGVTINDLMQWNEKKDLTLSVGEKLKVLPK